MELYEALSYQRRAIKMSFEELNNKTGISVSTLKKIFTGVTSNPAFETVRTIAYAMGITTNDLTHMMREEQPRTLSLEAQRFARDFDSLSEDKKRLARGFMVLLKQSDTVMDRLDAADEEDESVTG